MGTDTKPPRWTDALLRTLMNAQDAEIQSGDLLEAYRDSIYPARGRWQADWWYVRQVFGCVLRARGSKVRNWLLVGLALCVLTVALSLFMYPALFAGWVPKVAVGFLFYGYVAAFHSRPVTPEDAVVLRLGAGYGIACGVLWTVGVIGASFGAGLTLVLAYLSVVLPLVAGAHCGIKLWRVRAGMLVGFWSGLISGLIAFLVVVAFGYLLAFAPGLPGGYIPSQNHTYVYRRLSVGDSLNGGVAHLFGDAAISVIGATLGGLVGILFVRTGRGPEEPRRVVW